MIKEVVRTKYLSEYFSDKMHGCLSAEQLPIGFKVVINGKKYTVEKSEKVLFILFLGSGLVEVQHGIKYRKLGLRKCPFVNKLGYYDTPMLIKDVFEKPDVMTTKSMKYLYFNSFHVDFWV